MSATRDIMEDVGDAVGELVSPDDPWTDKKSVAQVLREDGYDQSPAHRAAERAEELDSTMMWHGLITERDVEVLRGVVEKEVEADVTRTILVGRANTALSELQEEDDGE